MLSDSAFGCRNMLGQVWEWTATAFYPFPVRHLLLLCYWLRIASLRCHALVFDLANSICTLLAECRVWIMEFHKSCVGVEQGFLPDFPYRENSCPWFGYRKVVKGGCARPPSCVGLSCAGPSECVAVWCPGA